ncbi:hypothetical protein TNCV_3164541 [Trichonephila clavipes]|nr:hypothetical protein TNCV_3164541 [Trichonephila clavipes]
MGSKPWEKLLHIKSIVVECSPVSVVGKSTERMLAQMSCSSLDCGSRIQDLPPIAFMEHLKYKTEAALAGGRISCAREHEVERGNQIDASQSLARIWRENRVVNQPGQYEKDSLAEINVDYCPSPKRLIRPLLNLTHMLALTSTVANKDDVPFRGTKRSDDEAHFWLNGSVNKQNCHIWSEANPQVYVETPLHPEKLTVWCALWAGGILLQKR